MSKLGHLTISLRVDDTKVEVTSDEPWWEMGFNHLWKTDPDRSKPKQAVAIQYLLSTIVNVELKDHLEQLIKDLFSKMLDKQRGKSTSHPYTCEACEREVESVDSAGLCPDCIEYIQELEKQETKTLTEDETAQLAQRIQIQVEGLQMDEHYLPTQKNRENIMNTCKLFGYEQHEAVPLSGDYDNPPDGCPNCGRARVMLCQDGKHHCEKCWWCIEKGEYDWQWWSPSTKAVVQQLDAGPGDVLTSADIGDAEPDEEESQ